VVIGHTTAIIATITGTVRQPERGTVVADTDFNTVNG